MKKKIILVSSAAATAIVLTGLILFLLLVNVTHEEEIIETGDKYIAAKSGLNLRSGLNKSSKVIITIPFGAMVTVEKSEGGEIFLDGGYGKWVNVKFGNKTGWVFSGFLCDFEPNAAIKVVADFYRDKYRKDKLSDHSDYYYGLLANFKDNEASIKNIINNYIVLEIPVTYADGFLFSGNIILSADH